MTMLAAYYERTGPAAEVLKLGELPLPVPAAGEVRVRVATSGVNPSDVKTRAGLRNPVLPYSRVVPHSDGAGVIDAVGEGVSAARVGERVWIWNGAWQRPMGSAAQFINLPTKQAVRLPEALSFEAGACLGIPALTALHAVQCHGGVAGQRVLIAGGAGAVGHYAVQMARLLGAAQVIATVSSAEKAAMAQAAGAHATIDYRSEDLAARIAELTSGCGVDRIIEVDFAANATADLAAIRTEGTIVVYGSGQPAVPVPFGAAIMKNVNMRWFIVYNLGASDRAAALAQLQVWLDRGLLSHAVAQCLPLEKIVQAHEAVESGRVIGNVVLQIS